MDFGDAIRKLIQSQSLATEGFYERLFAKHPEFRQYFGDVSLGEQASMLNMALLVAKLSPNLGPSGRRYLRILGARHAQLGVPKDSYPAFIAVLLEHLAEFHGDQWTDALAEEWSAALAEATQVMFEGYDGNSNEET